MEDFHFVSIVTLLALLVYFWMSLRVAGARRKSGIAAPAMVGDPLLERNLRVQGNTLEWLPIFIPSLWLFAFYWDDAIAAGIGLVWILARVLYALGYVADPKRRELGFLLQSLSAAVLLFGALGKAVWMAVQPGL